MFKKIAIFLFILAAVFYFILPKDSEPIEDISEEKTANNEAQYLTQKIVATDESELPQVEVLSLDEIQEKLDDISEQIDILAQEVKKLSYLRQVAGAETSSFASTSVEAVEDKEEVEEISTSTEVIMDNLEGKEKPEQKLCSIRQGLSPERNKIIINELAWAGGAGSSDDEWIELKNISGAEINLAGWQILSRDGQIKIIFGESGSILSGAFYILERTNDETLPQFLADKIYTGALKNDGDYLYLFDENCQFQDEVLAISGWPFGDNNSKRTMERKPDFGWQTSANAGGTPKAENSAGFYESFFGGG